MAKYNEILVGRFNRFLTKLTAMKGVAPAPQLAGEIVPSIPMFNGAENRYLESWDTYAINIFQGLVAAQAATIRVRNPGGSNVIAVFAKICATNGSGADQPFLSNGAAAADLATIISSNQRLDNRSKPASALILSRTTAGAALPVNIMQGSFPANGFYDFLVFENQEIPLLPGDAIQLNSNVVNTNFQGTFMWRERFLEDSERT